MARSADPFDAGAPLRAPSEERRAAVRYISSLTARCQQARGDQPGWRARIQDVSILGARLLVPVQIELATLLELDLASPTGHRVRTCLARVVHVIPGPAGGWLIGCAFVEQLSDDDLLLYQGEQVQPTRSDGRQWVRFPCDVTTVCWTMETATPERVPVRILNISPGGVGLLLPCQFETGTLLRLGLPIATARTDRDMLVRVVRSMELTHGDWFLGCEFAYQLGDEELRALR